MIETLFEFIHFWQSITLEKFIRMFWFFFIFDFARYVMLDFFVVLLPEMIVQKLNKNRYQQARDQLLSERPLVSVIAPGKNEGKHIPKLAESLKAQTYQNIEIIIVDDGSDDNTPEILKKTLQSGMIDKYFRNNVRGGKASAANLALRFSKGKYIVHLDADSHLYKDAIEKLIIPFYMDSKIGAVGGDIRINNTDAGLAATLQGIEYTKSISIGRRVTSRMGIMRIISGAFGAFRKDVLDRLGGWDVGPGLDGDITLKYRKLGYRVIFEPKAVCFTNGPTTFKKLAKQRYRWDRSMVRFRMRKHKDLFIPNANFDIRNFAAAADNVLFGLVLNINWWFYIIDMITHYTHILSYVIPMNYLLYVCSNFLQFTVNLVLSPNEEVRNRDFKLLIYLPLMPLYTGLFLRIVRTYSHLMELFYKKSYEDPWNPWKVSKIAKNKGM